MLDEQININSMKTIDFPEEEIATLTNQKKIITHRVSDDADKFNIGDIVITPWKCEYKITGKKVISNIEDSPFKKYLTKEQYTFLSDYDKISVLRLEKTKLCGYHLELKKQKN